MSIKFLRKWDLACAEIRQKSVQWLRQINIQQVNKQGSKTFPTFSLTFVPFFKVFMEWA